MKAIKIRHGNKGLSAATPLSAMENNAVTADSERNRRGGGGADIREGGNTRSRLDVKRRSRKLDIYYKSGLWRTRTEVLTHEIIIHLCDT